MDSEREKDQKGIAIEREREKRKEFAIG